jgi:undecaprenyl-diphosphatase
MTWLDNLILAVIEGITEYLPVSSTGHMMMAGYILKLDASKIDTYLVSVQFGAILAVVLLYYRRFFNFRDFSFYLKLLAGFMPAAILGFLFDDFLEQLLQTPIIVGITLLVVGVFLLFMEKWLPAGTKTTDTMSYTDAFKIGLVQSIAMIPGVSRSASTIAGSLGCKLSKEAATEFSFFLAVPTLSAAGFYKLYKNWDSLSTSQLQDIAIGNILSFITAILAVRFFLNLVKNSGFKWFGWYRIAAGSLFLAYIWYQS